MNSYIDDLAAQKRKKKAQLVLFCLALFIKTFMNEAETV